MAPPSPAVASRLRPGAYHQSVAMCAGVVLARHVDEFMGVPASGTAIALPGITILHFRGDRVIERFSQADMLGLLIQVGAVPALA